MTTSEEGVVAEIKVLDVDDNVENVDEDVVEKEVENVVEVSEEDEVEAEVVVRFQIDELFSVNLVSFFSSKIP